MLAISRTQSRYKTSLLVASALTSLWAGATFVFLIASEQSATLSFAADTFEAARTIAWMAAIAIVIYFAYGKRIEQIFAATLLAATAASSLYLFGAQSYVLATGIALDQELMRFDYIARVILAVCGLLLTENLFRNSGDDARWAVKALCFGVGTIFAYDFLLYAEAALFGRVDMELFTARGLVNTLAAPLIVLAAVRSRTWPIDLHVSRNLVFHSATLLGAGGYLIVISGASFYFTSSDGPLGTSFRILFLAAAAITLALLLASASIQARVKDFITRNFFSYRYDYRTEWLKFIDAISTSSAQLGIPDRIIRAIANIVESTDGALWVYRDEDRAYQPVANWNMGEVLPSISADDPFVQELLTSGAIVDLATGERDGRAVEAAIQAPDWLARHPRAWLALPLVHRGQMAAIAILGRRRVAAKLTWEDLELLKTATRQAASYAAEEQAGIALARARRFEDFNRQFAFVVHDLKNLSGQMSLILKNADRHGDNPEFQKDVLATISDSVERMHTMLQQLRDGRRKAEAVLTCDLGQVVADRASNWRLRSERIDLQCPEGPVVIAGIGAFQARQLARDVGGRLHVRSAPGQGTTMTVEFPTAPSASGENQSPKLGLAVHG